MDSKIILPIEVINKILVMRPKHPIAELMQKEIRSWRRKCYFYKHFFNNHDIIKLKKKEITIVNAMIIHLKVLSKTEKYVILTR